MKCAVQLMFGMSLAAGALAAPTAAPAVPAAAAASPAAHVQAVQELMAAMQTEKMIRNTASNSRYASEAQRKSVFDKLAKVPPAVIHQRLAAPVAKVVSAETAAQMTRFYNSPYGQKMLHRKYNSGPSMMMGQETTLSPAEKKELKRPEYVKASKALAEAEPAIEHETFVLLQAIIKQ